MKDETAFYQRQSQWLASYRQGPPSLVRRFLNYFFVSRLTAVAEIIDGGDVILDLGCSTGELLSLVGDRYCKLYGVDINLSNVTMAKGNVSEQMRGNGEALFGVGNLNRPFSFKEESVDTIAAIAILEHVFDVYGFVEECFRILKPGGILVIEVPNIAYFKHRIRLLFGKLPITSCPEGWREGFGWDGGHLHFFTLEALEQLLEESGFTIVRAVSSGGTFGQMRNIRVSLLAGNLLVKARKAEVPRRRYDEDSMLVP